MLRLLSASLCSLLLVTAFAQRGTIKVVDTDAMRLSAAKNTAMVDKTVGLSDEQRPQVTEAYMDYERSVDALKQRYARAQGMTPEQKQEELERLYATPRQQAEQSVERILTADQLAKWQAAMPKK